VLETYADTSRIPSLDVLDPTAFYVRWSFLVRADSRRIIDEVFEFVDGVADVTIEPWTGTEGSARPSVMVSVAPGLVAVSLPPSELRPSGAPAAPSLALQGPTMVPPYLAPEAVAEPQILHIPKLRAFDLGARGPAPSIPRPVITEAKAGESILSLKAPSIAPAARASLAPPAGAAAAAAAGEGATVRIATKKLDRILDILGEVVIAKSMISEGLRQEAVKAPHLREALATLERHTRELQDSVMSVRMVPMSTVFARYGRMVRELGTKLGKNVSLVLEGGETEIDRAMVEQLADPLTHLVRNAIDHGIERPDQRLAAGKPEAGQLKLVASHRGGNVVVEIMDDGRGLDLDRVRQKGIETGLLSPTDQPSLEALHMLVFQPGFSTAAQVTDVSGRGVGMDVVLRNVQALSGAINFTSQPGKGSIVSLQLPLTMAIIDGLLLRVGTSKLVVPLLAVVESLRPKKVHKGTVLNRAEVLHFRGATIPLVPLSEILNIPCPAPDPTRGIVIIVEACDMTVGLVVDELVANTQVVVKSIESNYQPIEGISGATVLGDGTIALILDVGAINRKVAATEPSGAGIASPMLAACG
jgi:two-component system chemotaxis sensor kinase CheA